MRKLYLTKQKNTRKKYLMLATVHRCANLHTHKHACIPYIHTLNKHLDIFFKINIICIPLETLRAEVHVHIRMCTCVCIFEQTYIVMYPHTSFSESHCSENGKAKGIQLSCRSLWWRHLTAVKKTKASNLGLWRTWMSRKHIFLHLPERHTALWTPSF